MGVRTIGSMRPRYDHVNTFQLYYMKSLMSKLESYSGNAPRGVYLHVIREIRTQGTVTDHETRYGGTKRQGGASADRRCGRLF